MIISVLVPTKNRHQYLSIFMSSIEKYVNENIEVVVCDNSDKKINCNIGKKIKYFHNPREMSMHENFEECLKKSRGKYIIFLGDDDFLTSKINDIVDLLENERIDCLIDRSPLRFWWNDTKHRYLGKFFSNLLREPKKNRKKNHLRKEESLMALNKSLKDAATEIKYLPRCYHAIASRESFEKIKKKFGRYFPGPTPDMGFASAYLKTFKFFHSIDTGFIVSGTAGGSAGGKGLKKNHKWNLSETPWFKKSELKQWPSSLPKIACGATLWAAPIINKLNYAELKKFNFSYLYARIAVSEKAFALILPFVNELSLIKRISFLIYILIFNLKRFLNISELLIDRYLSLNYKYRKLRSLDDI